MESHTLGHIASNRPASSTWQDKLDFCSSAADVDELHNGRITLLQHGVEPYPVEDRQALALRRAELVKPKGGR